MVVIVLVFVLALVLVLSLSLGLALVIVGVSVLALVLSFFITWPVAVHGRLVLFEQKAKTHTSTFSFRSTHTNPLINRSNTKRQIEQQTKL